MPLTHPVLTFLLRRGRIHHCLLTHASAYGCAQQERAVQDDQGAICQTSQKHRRGKHYTRRHLGGKQTEEYMRNRKKNLTASIL